MISDDRLCVGLQVVHFPPHVAKRNKTFGEALKDKDAEFGFIASWDEHVIFCRFWLKGKPGELRTVANSEARDKFELFAHESVSKTTMIKQINEMRRDPERYWWREGARWKEQR